MSTQLEVRAAGTLLNMEAIADAAEALAANYGEGASLKENDLIRIIMPSGGATAWQVPGINGVESCTALEGVIVNVAERGILWPSAEPAEGTLPVLVTHDMIHAHSVSDEVPDWLVDDLESAWDAEKGCYIWNDLPQTKFGSGREGSGKYATEQKVLFLMRPGYPLPCVVTVSAGSIKVWREFVKSLTNAGLPYYRAIVSIGLSKQKNEGGQPYSQLTFAINGQLPREEAIQLRKEIGLKMVDVANSAFV